jgi:hypothetical protein
MCWANVGFPLATLLANDVGPMKFCPFALGWPNDFCQQCLQFANKVPTNFWRKIWWANVGSILSAKKVYNLPIRYQQILVENYGGPTITLNIFYCSKRQKDKTQVKQLRQSSPITYISKYTIEHNDI